MNGIFYIGAAVLSTAVDAVKKTILGQIGSVLEGYVFSDKAEVWQTWGFSSRPSPPVAGTSAAECIAIRGDRDRIIAGRDIRGQAIYGNLKDGETCVYATGADGKAQGRMLIKADSSVNLYTRTDENATGMVISMTPSSDTIALSNASGCAIVMDKTGIMLSAGGKAGLKLGVDGSISMIGTAKVQVDGSGVVLGSIAVPVANAALVGPVGTAGRPSTKVLIEG